MSVCLNCGAKKSPGYGTCVSCGSNFEDQEKQYSTEQEKRDRIRMLIKQKREERRDHLRSEESKQAERTRRDWTKDQRDGIDKVFDFLGNLRFLVVIIITILALITVSFFISIITGIIVLIISLTLIGVVIQYKRKKLEKRNVFIAKKRKEDLAKEEVYKYCPGCGDLVLEKLRNCPKCSHEFSINN